MPTTPVSDCGRSAGADSAAGAPGAAVLPQAGVRGGMRMTLEMIQTDGDVPQPMPKTVLIVEDNELNMKLFNDLLEAHGYFTLQTKDGVEALRMARTHRPDLILMDIQLPEVSGLEVTKWLKERSEERRVGKEGSTQGAKWQASRE